MLFTNVYYNFINTSFTSDDHLLYLYNKIYLNWQPLTYEFYRYFISRQPAQEIWIFLWIEECVLKYIILISNNKSELNITFVKFALHLYTPCFSCQYLWSIPDMQRYIKCLYEHLGQSLAMETASKQTSIFTVRNIVCAWLTWSCYYVAFVGHMVK